MKKQLEIQLVLPGWAGIYVGGHHIASRTRGGKVAKAFGYAPHPETWRHLAYRYLRRVDVRKDNLAVTKQIVPILKAALAKLRARKCQIHALAPKADSCLGLDICFGRFIEATPI
jgi:hypothetical protein